MAFITRFNLVFEWSKIVRILTKKSSKWVRYNQVSWSSYIYINKDEKIKKDKKDHPAKDWTHSLVPNVSGKD